RAPINKAIDWVINKAVKLIKAAGKLFGGGKKKPGEKETPQDPEHDAKVQAGLAAIDKEEEPLKKNGKMLRKDAQAVAQKVRRAHPIFKSITVEDAGENWSYHYRATAGVKPGEPKAVPDKRFLPPNFKVRNWLFINGSGYGSKRKHIKADTMVQLKADYKRMKDPSTPVAQKDSLWTKIKSEKLDRPGTTRTTFTLIDGDYDVDHTMPLATHWVNAGTNVADAVRHDTAGGASNLKLMHASHNRSKGAGGDYYVHKPWVGPAFSSDYNASPANSLKIKGMKFRESLGGPEL